VKWIAAIRQNDFGRYSFGYSVLGDCDRFRAKFLQGYFARRLAAIIIAVFLADQFYKVSFY
jgi:hypothetical protein